MAELLKDLPSRGLLDPEAGPLVGRAPDSYVGDFDSAAPQVVASTKPNILLACLEKKAKQVAAKKKKQQQKKAEKQPAEERRKRPAQEAAGSSREAAGAAPKRQNTGGAGSGGGGGGPPYLPQQLRAKSNSELSSLLKERGLPHTGRKDMMVERLLNAQK